MNTQIRLHIDTHEPFADGAEYGKVGPYERVAGQVSLAVDPEAPAYQSVVDIEYARAERRRAGGVLDGLFHPEAGGYGPGQPSPGVRRQQPGHQAAGPLF